MSDEKIIERNFGKECPFKVPEGYFEHFSSQLMENLPEYRPQRAKHFYMRRIITIAACLVAAIIIASVAFFGNRQTNDQRDVYASSKYELSSSDYDDYIINQFSDYAMIDNDDFYSYVYGD
ncbi:MAG: hypothetical protein LUC37_05495 [Prevotella sp.]|nr:hypothetical protein [Prevotella sp.]